MAATSSTVTDDASAGLRAIPLACVAVVSAFLATVAVATATAMPLVRGEALEFALLSLENGTSHEEIESRAAQLAREPDVIGDYMALRAAGGWVTELEPDALPFSAEQELLFEHTARLLDRRQVVARVRADLGSAQDSSWRQVALGLLQQHAMASEVPLLVDLVGEDPALLDPFRDALAEVMRRDIDTLDQVRSQSYLPEPVALAMIRALGSAAEPEALLWLAEQLDQPGRTDTALQEIGRLARTTTALEQADVTAAAVRPFLGSESTSRRRQAMLALAELDDEIVAPRLVEALGSEDRGERKAAFAALVRLSGRRLPERVDVWQAWYLQELLWWRQEADTALERLSSDDDAEVVAAVRSISERSLRRDELAERIAPLLKSSPSPTVRTQVCLALARLDSRAGLGGMVLALEDPDAEVRSRALAGLRSVSGLDLRGDRDVWWDALAQMR